MTLVRLAAVLTLVELADLASYLQAPHLEANPLVAGLAPNEVAAAKVALVAIAWGLVVLARLRRWRPRPVAVLELAFIAGVAWAAFAAGTNIGTLATLGDVPRGTVR